MLEQITPLILTYNEAPNIGRTLERLSWAREIILVDSCSSDETRAIAASFANVRIVERPFTTHAEQWNFALRQTGVTTEWVLALDADFVLTDEVIAEMAALRPGHINGYRASFVYCVHGRPLRSAVYPPVTVLYRRAHATYEQDGHTQRVRVAGETVPLAGRILHDDRKPLAHWIGAQVRYMRLEADKLLSALPSELGFADRIRSLIIVAPPMMFALCLIGRGGILDGWPGLYYALQRAAAELILSLTLVERRLGRR